MTKKNPRSYLKGACTSASEASEDGGYSRYLDIYGNGKRCYEVSGIHQTFL